MPELHPQRRLRFYLKRTRSRITYSSLELDGRDDQNEETAVVIGVSYAFGGGSSAFAEYFALATTRIGVADDEAILMSGVTLGF